MPQEGLGQDRKAFHIGRITKMRGVCRPEMLCRPGQCPCAKQRMRAPGPFAKPVPHIRHCDNPFCHLRLINQGGRPQYTGRKVQITGKYGPHPLGHHLDALEWARPKAGGQLGHVNAVVTTDQRSTRRRRKCPVRPTYDLLRLHNPCFKDPD